MDFPCIDGSENGFAPGLDVDVLIRPEDLEIHPAGKGILDAKITSKLFIGMHYEMLAQGDTEEILSGSCRTTIPTKWEAR